MAGKKVFVGGLAPDVTDDDLYRFFQKAGPVGVANVIYDRAGPSRCFGYVEFLSWGAIPEALRMTGEMLKGHRIRVSKVKERAGG